MDINADRRALRKKILELHGIEVAGANDLLEAASIWHRDRYDVVLIDIRMDHRACMAWRDQIKKEKPQQIVAFLVGKPNYIDLDPLQGSYLAEEHGLQWQIHEQGDQGQLCLATATNGFVEAGWRIATARKLNGGAGKTSAMEPAESVEQFLLTPWRIRAPCVGRHLRDSYAAQPLCGTMERDKY